MYLKCRKEANFHKSTRLVGRGPQNKIDMHKDYTKLIIYIKYLKMKYICIKRKRERAGKKNS